MEDRIYRLESVGYMKDRCGRSIEYARISITDKCNLRCIYCTPGEQSTGSSCLEVLQPIDFERIVRAMAKTGIRKIRITGGEPLVRPDVCEIVRRISKIDGLDDISLTTNGIQLDKMAQELKDAGLHRLNISMDSLKDERYAYITGGGNLQATLKGIETSVDCGLSPLKINVVLVRGVNDDEIDDFIRLTKDQPLLVRFIEMMPIGRFGEDNRDKVIHTDEILKSRPQLEYCETQDKGQPATYYQIDGYRGRVGFISPISHKFCHECNRIRLTCDGKIRPCLGNNGEVDLLPILRKDPEQLDVVIRNIIYNKPEGHHFEDAFSTNRGMDRIGG